MEIYAKCKLHLAMVSRGISGPPKEIRFPKVLGLLRTLNILDSPIDLLVYEQFSVLYPTLSEIRKTNRKRFGMHGWGRGGLVDTMLGIYLV